MRIATLLLSLAVLAGCGAKGDLYLPPPEPVAAQPEPAAEVQQPSDQDEEDDKP